MTELVDQSPAVVLAVYAHPDDAEISCGGTLARWAADGSAVHLVISAKGDKGSEDPDTDVAELIERRAGEVRSAAGVLGLAAVHRLGHFDGELENDLALRGELVGLIRTLRPEVVVCPDPLAIFFGEHYFNHRDHRIVGWAALDAVSPAASSPLYFPEAGAAHGVGAVFLSGSLEPNVTVDVGPTIATKSDAVLCHQSQLGEDPEWLRDVVIGRAEEAGAAAGIRFGESFRRIRLAR